MGVILHHSKRTARVACPGGTGGTAMQQGLSPAQFARRETTLTRKVLQIRRGSPGAILLWLLRGRCDFAWALRVTGLEPVT